MKSFFFSKKLREREREKERKREKEREKKNQNARAETLIWGLTLIRDSRALHAKRF